MKKISSEPRTPNSELKWISVHLYYSEPWEKFLVSAMAPFVNELLSKGLAENWFFIRYWERGPHIRLRFNCKISEEAKLVEEVKNHFTNYFAQQPSFREDPSWLNDLPENTKWFPNNTAQFIQYEQELERYGGSNAIATAEKQFQLSSEIVLKAMGDTDKWDYQRALGTAIQMHIGFAYAIGMDIEETKGFYSYIFKGWFPMAYNNYKEKSPGELEELQRITLNIFRENFEKQKDFLIDYHEVLWRAFIDAEEFEEGWLNQWLTGIEEIKRELYELEKEERIVLPFFKSATFVTEEKQRFWNLYSSFIHMTNNRLGILNRDEGYLGYLIMNSLIEIENKKTAQT